jgi:exopolysaccharide biosynthesis protein PssK
MSNPHQVSQMEEHVRAHSTSSAVTGRLYATIHSVLQSYHSDAPYALLDFPDHPNVGDSAIWAGELAYLRRNWQHDPSYVCDIGSVNWSDLIRAVPSGPILLHGGGNFGDIWPANQLFREEVLNRYPSRTVIQLPQSIQFDDPSSLRRTARAIARHKSFVLLVRDQASYDLATDNFECEVRLCPDMAFCLGQLARPIRPTHSLVLLLRTDKEAASTSDRTALKMPRDALVVDWILSEPAGTYGRAKVMSWFGALASLDQRQVSPMARRVRYYDQLASLRIRRGITLISQGGQLISDRLHAHIIGTLLDVPQVILDNNYGKLGRFIDTWRSDWTGVRRAADLSIALEAAGVTQASQMHRLPGSAS